MLIWKTTFRWFYGRKFEIFLPSVRSCARIAKKNIRRGLRFKIKQTHAGRMAPRTPPLLYYITVTIDKIKLTKRILIYQYAMILLISFFFN